MLRGIIIAVLYALLLRFIFGLDLLDNFLAVVSISSMVLVPFIVGFLTIWRSRKNNKHGFVHYFFAPCLSILLFAVLTLLLGMESLLCWAMMLPVFLLLAWAGAFVGWLFKGQQRRRQSYWFSLTSLFLIPLVCGLLEHRIPMPTKKLSVATQIDVKADAETVWRNVVHLKEIKEAENSFSFFEKLGLPRPIGLELDREAVGGVRKAVFDKELFFTETITEYISYKKMVFEVKSHPEFTSSDVLDEHLVAGGRYFDVLLGKYEMESANRGIMTLHFTSENRVTTPFNFYVAWWTECMVRDVQERILAVIKERSEGS